MKSAQEVSGSAMLLFKMLLMLILWMHLILASEDTEAANVTRRVTRIRVAPNIGSRSPTILWSRPQRCFLIPKVFDEILVDDRSFIVKSRPIMGDILHKMGSFLPPIHLELGHEGGSH